MNHNKTKKLAPKTNHNTGRDIGIELRKHHFVLGNHGK